MPARSKFTEEAREKILQALSIGSSRRTAAAIAGVDPGTLTRWIERGKTATRGTRWKEFYSAVEEAEAAPRVRALGVIYKEMPDRPDLAWKFLERREPGYAPPVANQPTVQRGPVVIQLQFADGTPIALPVIDGEVVDEQEGATVLELNPAPPS